jgi:conjugal transfer pilus assembly protein TraB
MNVLKWFKTDPEGDFEDGASLNTQNKQRNLIALASFTSVLLLLIAAAVVYNKSAFSAATDKDESKPIDFGAVVDVEFTAKDNQSALSAQQVTVTRLEKTLASMEKALKMQTASYDAFRDKIKGEQESVARGYAEQVAFMQDDFKTRLEALNPPGNSDIPAHTAMTTQGRYLGQNTTGARQPPNSDGLTQDGRYAHDSQSLGIQGGIDHTALVWNADSASTRKRTIENYVPSGTVVTAVITGGADANAGVNGQGDTTPIVFQTLDNGLLPNGKKSRLNNCSITAAVYGEVSSSRGIARTNRMSCIFADDEIIDIPIQATVFNFGRNGIRGNTVIQNGKIVQMAGVASLLTAAGSAAKSVSETTSTSALGSTSTVNSGDILANMLGQGVEGAGKTLADYYIKLAEQYHPIIELNPGNVVNIVILKGFPLDAVGIEEYEATLAQQQSSAPSPAAQIMETITNPLLSQLPAGTRPTPGQASLNTQPFGQPQ